MFDAPRIDIDVEGVGTYWRPWSDLAAIVRGPKGIGLVFNDGTLDWIPGRVLGDRDQRQAFEDFIAAQLAQGKEPGAV